MSSQNPLTVTRCAGFSQSKQSRSHRPQAISNVPPCTQRNCMPVMGSCLTRPGPGPAAACWAKRSSCSKARTPNRRAPSHAAFPDCRAGRRPRLHFRGLLGLHSGYGPPDRSTAKGGLCHEASARLVALPSRLSATGPSLDSRCGWIAANHDLFRFAKNVGNNLKSYGCVNDLFSNSVSSVFSHHWEVQTPSQFLKRLPAQIPQEPATFLPGLRCS